MAALIAFALCYAGYRVYLHQHVAVDARVHQLLEGYLAAEVSGDITADAQAVSAAIERGDTAAAERLARGVVTRRVDLGALDLRGRGDNMVVRCAYTVKGPGGVRQKLGYFKFEHTPVGGWRCLGHTSVVHWHMAWLL